MQESSTAKFPCEMPVFRDTIIRWIFFGFVFVIALGLALGPTQPLIEHVRCLFLKGKARMKLTFHLQLLPSLRMRSC
jgi:hypothetical protein